MKYLHNLLPGQKIDFPHEQPKYVIKVAPPGTGKTTYELSNLRGNTLYVTSGVIALQQLKEAYPHADVHYQHEKSARPDSQLVITTYNSFRKVCQIINPSEYNLIVDEYHNFAASSARAFRGHAIEQVIDAIPGEWLSITLLSATPHETCHPTLQGFDMVEFVQQSPVLFVAKRIVWEGETVGKKGGVIKVGNLIDSVIANCDKGQTHLIHIDNKKDGRDKLRAGLIAKGFEDHEIAFIDADSKESNTGQSIINDSKLPNGVRVLITTSVMIEAANLDTPIQNVHLLSTINPKLAEQLVGRLRDRANLKNAYWYNSGKGDGYQFDCEQQSKHTLQEAQDHLQHIQAIADPDPDDMSQDAIARRRMLTRYAGKAGELIRRRKDANGNYQSEISYMGVDNEVFQIETEFCQHNPIAFKNATHKYGSWSWMADHTLIVANLEDHQKARLSGINLKVKEIDESEQAAREKIATEFKAERETAFSERLEAIRSNGEEWCSLNQADQDAPTYRAIQDVLRVKLAITRDWDSTRAIDDSENEKAFIAACGLVEECNDSRRKVNKTIRRIKIQQMRQTCAFTQAIYSAFSIGEKLTSEEIQQRLIAVYESDPVMEFYARERYKYPFSTDKESPITVYRATELLQDFFEVNRGKSKDDNGEWVHTYELISNEIFPDLSDLVINNNSGKSGKNEVFPDLSEIVIYNQKTTKVGKNHNLLDVVMDNHKERQRILAGQ